MAVPLRRPDPPPAPARRSAAGEASPRPQLRIADAIALVVGTIIGVGIFRAPSLVAGEVRDEALVLVAWLAGGLVSLVGALCYAELTSAYPHAGGDYHYLARAFGRRTGFLFAWARITVIQTGSIALLAFVLGDYAATLVPLNVAPAAWAGLTVIALTAMNAAGVRRGTAAQNVLTLVEVLGVLLIVGAGLALASGGAIAPAGAAAAPGPSAFGLAMVFVLLTFGGWNEAAYLSAELRDPGRTMAPVLVSSIVIVTVLYVLVNAAFLAGLGREAMAGSRTVAADLMERALGSPGARVVGAIVVVSALTSANAAVFTGARSAWALGRDFSRLSFLGRWHPRASTPINALLVQGVLALGLVALGSHTRRGFETMVEYTAPVFWLFFLLAGLAVFVLRWREPWARRPFRVPLYPLTPLVFCASCAYLLYSSLAYTGVGALVGVGVLLAGVLVLLVVHDRRPVAGGGGS